MSSAEPEDRVAAERAIVAGLSTLDRLGEKTGESLSDTATWLQEAAPETGPLATPTEAVAERLHKVGTYLQETNGIAALEDLVILIRRYPVQTLLLGFLAGYAVARWRRV